jgi:hypothetical protein
LHASEGFISKALHGAAERIDRFEIDFVLCGSDFMAGLFTRNAAVTQDRDDAVSNDFPVFPIISLFLLLDELAASWL